MSSTKKRKLQGGSEEPSVQDGPEEPSVQDGPEQKTFVEINVHLVNNDDPSEFTRKTHTLMVESSKISLEQREMLTRLEFAPIGLVGDIEEEAYPFFLKIGFTEVFGYEDEGADVIGFIQSTPLLIGPEDRFHVFVLSD